MGMDTMNFNVNTANDNQSALFLYTMVQHYGAALLIIATMQTKGTLRCVWREKNYGK